MNTPPDIAPVAIIGAGAAAISAATWLHLRHVPFVWLSEAPDASATFGGTLNRVHNTIKNYPPNHYPNGAALVADFQKHLARCEIPLPRHQRVDHITVADNAPFCTLLSHTPGHPPVHAKLVILATGTRYRRLHIPGEDLGAVPYLSQSSMADAARFAGQTVAVVGAGDAAFENALHLAEHGCTVHLLARNHQFRARAAFVQAALQHPNITLFPTPVQITRIHPAPDHTTCTLELATPDGPQQLHVSCLFVRVGVEPTLPTIEPALQTTPDGYILTDFAQRTSHPLILAAGDVTHQNLRAVATATGSGATAARTAADLLEKL